MALLLGILPWTSYYYQLLVSRSLSGPHAAVFPFVAGSAICVLGIGAWAAVWGFRQVAISVSCDESAITFHYAGRRPRRIPWSTTVTKFNVHDWREWAYRTRSPDTFAISARWGQSILAILSPESFEAIMATAQSYGLTVSRGRVNKWLTGSPLSTVVYRFA